MKPFSGPPESFVGRQMSHYSILSALGAGGMGEVYLARDVRLDRTVALKVLSTNFASNPERAQRFIREARAASAFNHANVAAIYDIGEDSGHHFIAMEYVEGQTLAAKIAGRPMDPGEIVEIVTQVADALSEAHAKGITHRDIKPGNLMLTSRGQVKVLDFGLAKMTPTEDSHEAATVGLTQLGGVIGTVQYMSPEQVLGRELDHRTDIFSLGVVLYEMATGRLPFAGASLGETMDRILHAQLETLPQLDREDIARIVGKCLEKDRERRYQSMHELWVDLKNLQRSSGSEAGVVEATKPQPLNQRRRWVAGKRWLLWPVAIITVASVAVGLWLRNTQPVLSFSPRDWVLITDVENQAGDPVFDKSLLTAFQAGLEQSRYANVFPRTRASEALKRMKKTGTEPIDETLGRDIALREGVRAVIIPTISKIGDTYQLTARLHDPSANRDVRTEQVRATGTNKVLNAVDELVAKLRVDLGESLPAIAETSKPLAQVTTASLDALQQFSIAIEKQRAANFAEAKTYYENALRIDPGFTTAKAQLGILHSEFFNAEEGKRLLSEVIEHADSVTDREKYGILAFHARVVENDLPKAIQIYKLLLGLHPDEWSIQNNLGWFNFQLGRGEDAVAAYKEALRLDPYGMISYNGFTMVYLYLAGDLDAAIDICRKQLAYDDRQWFAHNNMGWAYLGKDDLAAAQQSFEKALEVLGLPGISADSTEVRSRLGFTHLLQGRYRDALERYLSIPSINSNEYYPYYYAGIACQLAGDIPCQRENFAKFINIVRSRMRNRPTEPVYQLDLAKALTRTGQTAQGQALGTTATRLKPTNYFAIAQLLSVQGKTNEAIQQLELAIQNGFRNFVWMKVDPDLRSLQDLPRFRELLKANLKGLKL